ncbi:hypothetical protein D0962_16275 [Leptolyngbyaceae cyanobacterium CCMR0082]|uniref:Tyr recombinase domain-containing protein n=1 Tax=Adonisia turfae CCMR0082 TaxID=2304604 RepID=A0A6M0S7I0_9CYAN|nr:hypothetical protein [Adonisia turfae]NEZ64330.1 hypothetical protein [Adonisia turfae CCMR0082]
MAPKDCSLQAVNGRLKATCIPVSVQKRGARLILQATLPPKPASNKRNHHQQQISTGLPDNQQGRRKAEGMAITLGGKLLDGTFKWDDYATARTEKSKQCAEVVKRFEKDYRQRNQLENRTWQENWHKVFKQLPRTSALTADILRNECLSKPENSRTRQQTCQRLQALANFAGIDVDLLQYQGNYGPSKVKERDLPSDELIAQWREQIPNRNWQWVYGMMAAYGIRPHEVFFCEFTDEGLQVLKGKTGPRLVYQAFYPEWVERWNLTTVCRPKVNAEASYEKGNLGRKINTQFRRYKMPFSPYDLRHAWAIRSTVLFRVPETVSAQLLGHTPDVHLKIYQRWIDIARGKQAIKQVMSESNLPAAPLVPIA